jgi:hypothetical protein
VSTSSAFVKTTIVAVWSQKIARFLQITCCTRTLPLCVRWAAPLQRRHRRGNMTIKFLLLVNKQGQTRLAKYFTEQLSVDEKRALEAEIVRKCLARTDKQVGPCSRGVRRCMGEGLGRSLVVGVAEGRGHAGTRLALLAVAPKACASRPQPLLHPAGAHSAPFLSIAPTRRYTGGTRASSLSWGSTERR